MNIISYRIKKKSSISKKFILLTSSSIILAAMIIAFFVVRQEIKRTYQELLDDGQSIATIMATNSEYAIYSVDKASLQQIIKSIESYPAVAYVVILNLYKQ